VDYKSRLAGQRFLDSPRATFMMAASDFEVGELKK
jgi:hypothetical protein